MNIAELIKETKDTANEAIKRLNDYTNMIHATSTDGINTNADGAAELGGIVSDLVMSVSELATLVSDQEKRITDLEKAAGKGETK